MLEVMAGHDRSDPTSAKRTVPDLTGALGGPGDLDGVRIGVVRELRHLAGADPLVLDNFEAALGVLSELGLTVVEVTIPHYAEVIAAVRLTLSCEAMAYHRPDLRSRWDDYHARTRSTVGLGAFISGPDYVQAQRVRRLGQRGLSEVFDTVDVIATPTVTVPPPSQIDACGGGKPLASISEHIHTIYWDGVGNPVLAAPTGFTTDGLPSSMQLAGRPFDERTILGVGHAFQQATDWHRRVPEFASEGLRETEDADEAAAGQSTGDAHVVRTMFAVAGLSPHEDELAGFVSRYAAVRELIDRVHGVAAARHESPSLVFEAAPDFAAWSGRADR